MTTKTTFVMLSKLFKFLDEPSGKAERSSKIIIVV
jgi:hypothetical protein